MKRVYSIPFVVTVAAAVVPACGFGPHTSSNPPAPCPNDLPEEGAACWPETESEPDCHYTCPEGDAQAIVRCVPVAEGGAAGEGNRVSSHIWKSNGACEPQGGSNQGGAAGH